MSKISANNKSSGERGESLALDGGQPTRDLSKRPWPSWPVVGEDDWERSVGPMMKKVFLSGVEGLPGPLAREFGRRFAAYCGIAWGRLLVHGTDAVSAALTAALDLDAWTFPGEIIVPNYTYIASASAPIDRRFTVAFVDVDPDAFTLDPDAFEAAIRPGVTKAVLPVHIAGHPADMDRILEIARKHDLAVVEDCAQAHGARYKDRFVGGIGHAGAFSFQSSKNLTAGEGGLVTTNDEAIDARVVSFMNCGRHPRGERWEYPRIGWNYRPSEYVAALLLCRLEALEGQIARRERMAAYLGNRLSRIPGVKPPAVAEWCGRHAYHLYCMQIDTASFGGRSRKEVVKALNAEGIPALEGYTTPLSDQAGLRHLAERHPEVVRVEDCPNTRQICARSVWLPQEVLLGGESDMDDVVAAFSKAQKAFALGVGEGQRPLNR